MSERMFGTARFHQEGGKTDATYLEETTIHSFAGRGWFISGLLRTKTTPTGRPGH